MPAEHRKRRDGPPGTALVDGQAFYERSCQDKRAYKDVETAGRAAQRYKEKRPESELRIYPCGFCGQVHLTSATLEDVVERMDD